MKFSKILILLSVLIFAKCHIEFETLNFLDEGEEAFSLESEQPTAFLQSTTIDSPLVDGTRGYNSMMDELAPESCFNVESVSYSDEKFEDLTKNPIDDEKLDSYFSRVELTQLGLGSRKISDDFQGNGTSEKKFSRRLFYVMKYTRTKTIRYAGLEKERLLNEYGLELLQKSRPGSDRFLRKCGNQIVTSVTEGGISIVGATLSFSSIEFKQKFDFRFKLSVAELFSFGITLKSIYENEKISGQINFFPKQFGGDQSQLASNISLSNKACSEALNQTKDIFLNFHNQKKCNEFVKSFRNYADNFRNQFKSPSATFFTFDYTKEDIKSFVVSSNDSFDYVGYRSLKNKLKNYQETNEYYLTNLNFLLTRYVFKDSLRPNLKTTLERLRWSLDENRKAIEGAFSDCRDNLNKCPSDVFKGFDYNRLKNVFEQVDSAMLPMKDMWKMSLRVSDCALGVPESTIDLEIYPLGEEHFDLLHTGGSISNQVVARGWSLKARNVKKWNNFEIQLIGESLVRVYHEKNPWKKIPENVVTVKCHVGAFNINPQIINQFENPYYFPSKRVDN